MTPFAEQGIDSKLMKTLLLDIAQERSACQLLTIIVDQLAELPDVALARIWLIQPGDICTQCHMREECSNQTACLHLMASAGHSTVDPKADWSYLNGFFRRFPIGVRKVGSIAETGRAIEVTDCVKEVKWIARPQWAAEEGIKGFTGQPLIFKGDVLGVLAVFTRSNLQDSNAQIWLRMMADHAAAAIANARAFEEIDRLKAQLELENEYLREEVNEAQEFGDIVGHSPSLRAVLRQVELVAPTDASVLILGESGTGKELIAREIHRRSARCDGPLIRVNCASIPKDLYESEFFGHIQGAFTGALKDRAGRFEAADRGTLFLDEVGEIPLELQSKLLRVLQEGTYERVGEENTREVDVRIFAATNRDLKKEAEQGRFRQDLYYRLNVFPIEIAPLHKRKEDIAPLAAHFLDLACSKLKLNRSKPRLTQANVLELQQYDWPGNVRELQNVIERAVITCRSRSLCFDLPASEPIETETRVEPKQTGPEILSDKEMKRLERKNIAAALQQSGWKIYGPAGAAELLGMKPTTLTSRIRKLGLKRPR